MVQHVTSRLDNGTGKDLFILFPFFNFVSKSGKRVSKKAFEALKDEFFLKLTSARPSDSDARKFIPGLPAKTIIGPRRTNYFAKAVSNALPMIVSSGKGNPSVPDSLPLPNDWRREVLDTSYVGSSKLQAIILNHETFELLPC